MKICVVGCGYVGLATTVAISKKQNVTIYDIDSNKLDCLRKDLLPIDDDDLKEAYKMNKSNIIIEEQKEACISNNDCFILALPTDAIDGLLDITILEKWIEEIVNNKSNSSMIVIRSTVPVGFTKSIQQHLAYKNLYYWPEFLREGRAFYDIENPSRVVLGGVKSELEKLMKIIHGNKKLEFPVFYTTSQEAEAIKLFSNAYLAMRISFFNEIDSFSEREGMNPQNIIEGVCADSRIGNYYNNPSFGYGGYCLPKDTKQIAYQFSEKDSLINAISKSNELRKINVVKKVISISKKVGIYRLQMKKNSDNIRGAASVDIINELVHSGAEVRIFEPMLMDKKTIHGTILCKELSELYNKCDIILANRIEKELLPYMDKVYTRDLFYRD